MSDWQDARNSAVRALHGRITFHSSDMIEAEELAEAGRALDAALADLKANGYVIAPQEPDDAIMEAMEGADYGHYHRYVAAMKATLLRQTGGTD